MGKTDEDNLGFTYAELDRYIRTGLIDDQVKKERIDTLHRINLFKLKPMPAFEPDLRTVEARYEALQTTGVLEKPSP